MSPVTPNSEVQRQPAAIKESRAAAVMRPGVTTSIPPFLADAALRIAITAFSLGTLAGVAFPIAITVLSPTAWQVQASIKGSSRTIPRTVSANRDVFDSNGVKPWQRQQLHLYLLAWSTFHFLEFAITARWNRMRLFSDSFLIQNGIAYHLAHIFGVLEFLIEAWLFPELKRLSGWTCAGLATLVLGQIIRSLAMVQAGGNFSHQVAEHKREDHELVTNGLYAYLRHPSYFGFFYWAIGSQILLHNPISTLAFVFVLWRFFSHRIEGEEEHLVSFFGEQYIEYRKRTRTLIPFIG